MYFNQKAINNFSESLSNKYNGIDTFATFDDGFNFKIKRDSFSDIW